MPADQRIPSLATIDEAGTDEDDDTLEELPSFGSSGPLSNARSLYMHQADQRDVSETAENAFFSVDDDTPVLQQLVDKASAANLTQSCVSVVVPSVSRMSLASLVSYKTFLPIEGCYGVFLTHLCDMIDMYPTLQQAKVISTECYTTPIRLRIVHRFLLLELRREGLKPIWMRLDRTRNKFTSSARFVLNGARTRANDIVQISAIKGRLIPPRAHRENQQAFDSPPCLGDLHHFMWTVVHELTAYRLFSENCWFFVSLLQQYLNDSGKGKIDGRITTPGVDRGVETRIRRQAMILRDLVRAARSLRDAEDPSPSFAPTDLACFARYMLRHTPNVDADSLANRCGGSMLWLVTACLYLSQGDDVDIEEPVRLEQVLNCGEGMDALYIAILGSGGDGDALKVRLRFLKLMLSVKESLPLDTLLKLPPPEYFPLNVDVLSEVRHLSSLLTGCYDGNPVAPYQLSFTEFLSDANRSGHFSIDPAEPLKMRALRDAANSITRPNHALPSLTALTLHDMELFVHQALRSLGESSTVDRALLAGKAYYSLDWAAEACRVVMIPAGLEDGRNRLHFIACQGPEMYFANSLGVHCGDHGLVIRKQFLILMLSVTHPLPLDALLQVPPPEYFPPNVDILSEIQHLSSLLAGCCNDSPVAPYHRSFLDFLGDMGCSGQFYIDPAQPIKLRALCEAANSMMTAACVLPDIPDITQHDIELFVHQALRSLGPSYTTERAHLARKADGSLTWALEACRTVTGPAADTHDPTVQLHLITSEGLDAGYKAILAQCMDVMQLEKLLPFLNTLLPKRARLQFSSFIELVSASSEFLAGTSASTMDLLQGALYIAFTTSGSCASAFWDFLVSPGRSGRFQIDAERMHKIHAHLVEYCVDVMNGLLRFNIADIPTSLSRNADIPDIQQRVRTNIPPLLSYCCRLWPLCVSISLIGRVALPSLEHFLENQMLQWLEVMSLTQSSPEEALAPLAAVTKMPSTMSTLIADIMQFVKTFSIPIMRSVPHIYISALTFIPECSVITSQRRLHPGIVRVNQGALTEWPCSLQVLEGHSRSVYSVAFSPDGTHIASGSANKTIRLWNTRTGSVIGQLLVGHGGDVKSVAFSPDGAWIASGSDDNTVRLWDAQTGTVVGQPLIGHSAKVWCVAISPDGARIASGSADNTVRLWDARTGAVIGQPLTSHSQRVWSVAFSPDGARIVSGSADNTIRLWDVQTGAAVGEPLFEHYGLVLSVAFSPNGGQIASGFGDNTVRLWDTRTDAVIGQSLTGHSGWVRSIAFSPDGARIASGSNDQTIRLWDARTGAAIGQPLAGHSGFVLSVAFSPDGAWIASGSVDKTVCLWDAQTGTAIGQPLVGHSGWVRSVAFSPDGAQIASGSDDKTIRLWDAQTGAAIGQPLIGHSYQVWSVAFSPDGARIASGSDDGTVRVWDAAIVAGRHALSQHSAAEGSVRQPAAINQPTSQSPNLSIRKVSPSEVRMEHSPQRASSGELVLKDGWIVGPADELLLWVPPAHRTRREQGVETWSEWRKNKFTVDHTVVLDFQSFKYGTEWTQCRGSGAQ